MSYVEPFLVDLINNKIGGVQNKLFVNFVYYNYLLYNNTWKK